MVRRCCFFSRGPYERHVIVESVRDKIVKDEAFWSLSRDYYDGNLEQNLENKGPRTGADF